MSFGPSTSPLRLLDKLCAANSPRQSIAFIEGWTFRQMRAALADPGLKHDTSR